MKIAVGILCWNQEANNRVDLFDQCLKSVEAAGPDQLVIMDNGSTDGTADRIAALEGGVSVAKVAGYPHGNTCGYGMNKLAVTLAQLEPDLIVMSNDDIVWSPDAFGRLHRVWAQCEDKMAIVSGLVEPTFSQPQQRPWNEVLGVAKVAGEDFWLRRSAPGGAWSFRPEMMPNIFPVSTFPGLDDVPACHRLVEQGFGVGAVDLASHAGIDSSTWGNASHAQFVVETLDEMKERWL